MLLPSYGILLGIGLLANLRDWRMLALTLLVGANILAPIPSNTREEFFFWCFIAELCLLLGAFLLRAKASIIVIQFATVLVLMHVMGYYLGTPHLSPYRVIVKVCEYSQLFLCIAFSPGLFTSLRNRLS
jgi:hypothetical protein